MTFSCTKKVQDRLKKFHAVEMVKVEPDFYNWYIDQIILERKKFFLFTHAQTLFSFFIYFGTQGEIKNLSPLFKQKLEEQIIREISSQEAYLQAALPDGIADRFVKTNSRSILGSMNDFKYQIEAQVWHKGPLSRTYSLINHLINQVPMSGIAMNLPQRKFKEELAKRV